MSDKTDNSRSSLSHDFYQIMIGSESMSLYGWKQLAKWSLEHSCMNPREMAEVTQVWEAKWAEFCRWIFEVYGPMFGYEVTANNTAATVGSLVNNNFRL
jgi:adenosine deaminase CECR1